MLLQTYYLAPNYYDGRKKIVDLIAQSSGAEWAATGFLNLLGQASTERCLDDMTICTRSSSPRLTKIEATQLISRTVAPQLLLFSPRQSPKTPKKDSPTETPLIWLKSPKYLIALGRRVGQNVSFSALIFGQDSNADTPERRNLIRISQTYVDQLPRAIIGQTEVNSPKLFDAILQNLAFGFFVVDIAGVIHYFKDSSNNWLANNKEMTILGRRLRIRNLWNQQMFHNALITAAGPQLKTSVLKLDTMSEKYPGTIVVLPLQGTQPRAMVVFGQDKDESYLLDLFLRTFDLTLAERGLALHLLGGKSLREAAREANLTISTARSYLKCVFAKTGMHRQSELVTMCLQAIPSIQATSPTNHPH